MVSAAPSEIVIGDRCKKRLLAPDRQYVEDSACNKERDRKMNDDRMLGVACEQRSLHIERIRAKPQKQFHNTTFED